MDTQINFGLKIKKLLDKQPGTIEEKAERLGYTRAGINKIIDKEDVNTSILKKLGQAFGVGMAYFLTETNYNVSQQGNGNIVRDSQNGYSKAHNVELSKVPDGDILLLRVENEGLKSQLELLKSQVEMQRELIEFLKTRQ